MMERIFEAYLRESVGEANAEVTLAALSNPASVSIRLNPSKVGQNVEDEAKNIFGPQIEQIPWSKNGFFLSERPQFTLDPAMHAGCYYVQDSSAMFVGHVFRKMLEQMSESFGFKAPLRVLDLCAAPGGKTTDIVSSLREKLGGSFVLVSNEIMKQRATVLADNAGIWGDPAVVVTSVDPAAFSAIQGYFDIIIADVPCSGEGMFRKDAEAVAQWSADNVSLCQSRQRRIIADVWSALAPGGVMVYSTCTFNHYENDDNVCWAASELGADIIKVNADFQGLLETKCGISLLPGLVPGEGQYCAVLRKHGNYQPYSNRVVVGKKRPVTDIPTDVRKRVEKYFDMDMHVFMKGDMIVAMTDAVSMEMKVLECFHPLLRGTAVGQLKGRDIIPDADLALCIMLRRGVFNEVELDRSQALAFLHKDTLTLSSAERGILLLTFEGHPIGFVKNLGNRCNSLHPQHRRIRMDL